MNKQGQALLDKQADALEARNPAIIQVRNEISQLLVTLQAQTRTSLGTLTSKLETQGKQQQSIIRQNKEINDKLKNAEQELFELKHSDLATTIADYHTELTEIDKQMALLQKRRSELSLKLDESESLIGSREARFEKLIAALKLQFKPVDPTPNSILEQQIAAASLELDAAAKGQEVWGAVCTALAALDVKITTLELSQALSLLEETSSILFSCLETAKSARWGLLVTAIGHEYAVIEMALDAVRSAL